MPALLQPKDRIRFRLILPIVYIVLGGFVVGNCLLHLGHSPYCRSAYYFLLPAGLVSMMLVNAIIPWGGISHGPIWSGIEMALLPVPFLATCLQYYLLGLLLDKLVKYWRSKRDVDN